MMTVDYRVRESGIAVPAASDVKIFERIAELEFASEDQGWIDLGTGGESFEFSRSFVQSIVRTARLTWLKNPIVQRGVNVKADYIFGRQVSIHAPDETVNDVIQTFLNDPHNQTEFTAQAARIQKERELQTDGNIFFVLVPHMRTGAVRIRTLDVEEITDIITDPNDRKAAWYYKREYTEQTFNYATGATENKKRVAYYRDWRNVPLVPRTAIGDAKVIEGQYIYHIKVGGFSNWKFGISELYSALDWTKAYKVFLENWSTIVAAYARFAFKVTTTGGKPGVDQAVKRLSTTAGTSQGETNPKPVTGANFVRQNNGTDIDPIRTAGATTSAEDGRRLLLMVCAAFGLPETFFGDVSVGTLATAKSLDRPTELMISNRQVLWQDIYNDILQFVLYYAVSAIDGPLRAFGDVIENEYGETTVEFDDTIDTHIDIDFPSVVERDMTQTVAAIVQGATFDGKTPTIIPNMRVLARLVLTALGENDIDQLLDEMYNEDGTPKIVNTPSTPAVQPGGQPGAPNDPNAPNNPIAPGNDQGTVDPLAEAAATLRASIDQLREALYPADRRVSLGDVAPHLKPQPEQRTITSADIDVASFMKP